MRKKKKERERDWEREHEKKKLRETQITNIKILKGHIISDYIDIKKIVMCYFEWLYANKLNKFDEMDKSLVKTQVKTNARRKKI